MTAHLPLALAVVLDSDGVLVEFEYQTDVLGAALVDQMLAHYIQLLDNALSTPERRLASLDMLGGGERESVLAAVARRPCPDAGHHDGRDRSNRPRPPGRTRSRWFPTRRS